MTEQRSASAVAGRRNSSGNPAVAVAALLGLAAMSWLVAVRQTDGMDMGVATEVGSFGSFVAAWLSMMAAMMLPAAAPAVVRHAHAGLGTVPLFVASYLAVWLLAGLPVFALYRPHGSLAAGVAVIVAGLYELTPVKRRFRRHGRERLRSGFEFGFCCVGSSIGLMLMLVMLGLMSLIWMSAISVLVFAQKVLPPKAATDVPLAVAIVGFGVLIVLAPSSVPGLLS